MAEDKDDDIIELTQVVGAASAEEKIIELTDVTVEPDVPEAQETGGLERFSREDLDAALERVIEKKFSQSIETILFEVMEKVIKKEIKEIKAGLQKDLDEIDNA